MEAICQHITSHHFTTTTTTSFDLGIVKGIRICTNTGTEVKKDQDPNILLLITHPSCCNTLLFILLHQRLWERAAKGLKPCSSPSHVSSREAFFFPNQAAIMRHDRPITLFWMNRFLNLPFLQPYLYINMLSLYREVYVQENTKAISP